MTPSKKAPKVKNLKPKVDDVKGGKPANKAQSDMSSKWSQSLNGIAQNFK